MAYADLLMEEGINSQFLMVLKPRRRPTGFTVFSGSVYSTAFDYGTVTRVECDGVALTQGSSTTLSAGQFFWETDVLYVRTSDSVDPDTKFTIAVYEIYCATFDAHWHRDPLDTATTTVYFEPILTKSPGINASATDSLFGYLPTGSASIELSNAIRVFEKHLYDGSFNQAEVKMWHWLSAELSTDNIALVLSGVCGDVSFQGDSLSITALDRVDIFASDFRHTVGESFFATSDFADLDPNFQARPIRKVYGVVDGFVPVNIDYEVATPTSSDNRNWVCIKGQTNLGSQTKTVTIAGTNTTTRTYLNSVVGLQIDDAVWMDRIVGVDDYTIVRAVGANYIDHDAIAAPMVLGDSVKRSFVGNVTILKDQVRYRLLFGRDYTENTSFAATTSGFTLSATLEIDQAMPSALKPTDLVYARVYGQTNQNTFDGNPLGSDDLYIGVLANPVTILYELLKTYLGLPESEIDGSAFDSLQGLLTEGVGFAVPATSKENFPAFKDLITQIVATSLLRVFINNDNQWTVRQLAPAVVATKTIDDTEILRDSFSYTFEHADILSDVIVEYATREVGDDQFNSGGTVSRVNTTSDTAIFLHKVQRQKTFQSLHFHSWDAQALSDRLSFIFGDRKGTVTIQTKNRFFDSLLNDVISTTRVSLPGFDYDADIERTRDLVVLETRKSLGSVDLTLDDQKGIEDNAGSW